MKEKIEEIKNNVLNCEISWFILSWLIWAIMYVSIYYILWLDNNKTIQIIDNKQDIFLENAEMYKEWMKQIINKLNEIEKEINHYHPQ